MKRFDVEYFRVQLKYPNKLIKRKTVTNSFLVFWGLVFLGVSFRGVSFQGLSFQVLVFKVLLFEVLNLSFLDTRLLAKVLCFLFLRVISIF